MTRLAAPLVALLALSPAALGQGFTNPPTLGAPVGLTPPGRVLVPPPPLWGLRPIVPVWYGGWGYYGYNSSVPWVPTTNLGATVVPPPLVGAGGGPAPVARDVPATLTVELPADAEVWVNGDRAGTGRTHTLTSPALKPGATHSFAVTARWSADGRRYEWERTVVVAAGDKSRVTVAAGFLVKD